MKKFIIFLLAFITIQSLLIIDCYAFSGLGSGTSGDPYQITNVNQLQEMNNNLNAYYILMNDIDATVTSSWNSGAGFMPIYNFIGTFDGLGHKITGLFIYRPFWIGLFGSTVSGAIIKNVGLVDVKITGSGYPGGSNYIGALVGYNNGGTITNSYATGSVRGDLRIGGLVGENTGTITNSYTTASVTGVYHVGGLSGSNYGAITNSYATGRVTAYFLQGGLIGWNNGGTITNSYWDKETSGQTTSGGGTGKTTAEMKTQSTYIGWDFTNIWCMCTNDYPKLKAFQLLSGSGSGTSDDPYRITNIEQLQEMNCDLDAYYILMNEIDASATSSWNSGAGFVPIDNFTGTLDGQGHNITGLFINRHTMGLGLLGGIGSSAIIKNVGLVNVNITGSGGSSNFIGGLVAYNCGAIINCYVTGSVKGDQRTGGLVGMMYHGTITNSYATASVTSSSYQVGGLVGTSVGTITNCYATGRVTAGSWQVGGLNGWGCWDIGGTMTTNSYWDKETSSRSTSDGGTGKTTAEMMQQSTYENWDFTNIWCMCTNDYPKLRAFPDNTPPTAICKNITVQLDENGIITITADDIDNGSIDECGIKSIEIDKTTFGCADVGVNTVTLTVTDNNDNTATCDQTVTVEDNIPPTITVSLNPSILWPANNQLRTINATINVTDNCSGTSYELTSITSNEDISDDVENAEYGTADLTFDLRAQRDGKGTGRIYTVLYTATDASGNTAVATATVKVPHDVRREEGNPAYRDMTEYNNIIIKPNPLIDYVIIEGNFKEKTDVNIILYNLLGEKIYRIYLSDKTVISERLSLEQLQPGTYFVEINYGAEKVIRKIVKL